MSDKFLKWNVAIFEIVAFISCLYLLSTYIYYHFFFNFQSGLYKENLFLVKINYTAEIEHSPYSDVTLRLDENSNTSAYVIANKKYFTKDTRVMPTDEILQELNKTSLNEIFLFADIPTADRALGKIGEVKVQLLNYWNKLVLCILLLFLVFIYITSVQFIRKMMKKHLHFSLLNPKIFYRYVILHLSLIVILPLSYISYQDYSLKEIFSFKSNSFFSFFYDRTFAFKYQEEMNYLQADVNKVDTRKNLFALRDFNELFELSYNYNPCGISIIFLCVFVWITGSINLFELNEQHNEAKWRKVWGLIAKVCLYFLWIGFFIYGSLDVYDNLALIYIEIFYSGRKLLYYNFSIFLLSFYFHVYFYSYLIYYTIRYRETHENETPKRKTGLVSSKEKSFNIHLIKGLENIN